MAAAQATIRTADGAAILIDQRNNLPQQMERQGGRRELAEIGDGPRLWHGPNKGRKKALGGGQCLRRVAVWKDRAGGAAALQREKEEEDKVQRWQDTEGAADSV